MACRQLPVGFLAEAKMCGTLHSSKKNLNQKVKNEGVPVARHMQKFPFARLKISIGKSIRS